MSLIAYARVSSETQRLDMQLDALNAAGADRIFEDQGVSGTLAHRPGLDAALDYLREGDVFLVYRLDRLSRSTRNTLSLLHDLGQRGIGFRSLSEALDTTGPMGKVLLALTAAFGELEHDLIVDRTRAGLAAARERGNIGGRPKSLSPAMVEFAQQLRAHGKSAAEIAKEVGTSRATVYRALAS